MNTTLREKLWDFAYDLLDFEESERLRAEITSSPQLARDFARVMLEVDLLRQASSATLYSVDFEISGDALITPVSAVARAENARQQLAKRVLWLFSAGLSGLLLCIACFTYFGSKSPVRETAITETWNALAEEHPRLLVTGPAELQTGLNASYQCIVNTVQNKPLHQSLQASLHDMNGRPLWRDTRTTNAGGELRFNIPTPNAAGNYQLIIENATLDTDIVTTHKVPQHLETPLFSTWLHARGAPAAFWNSFNYYNFGEYQVQLNRIVALQTTAGTTNQQDQAVLNTQPNVQASLEVYLQQKVSMRKSNEVELSQASVLPGVNTFYTAAISHELPLRYLQKRSDVALGNQNTKIANHETIKLKNLLVEGLSVEQGILGNRFLLSTHDFTRESSNVAAVDGYQLLDYQTAPPQVLQSNIVLESQSTLQKLKILTDFDRKSYSAGETVHIKIQVQNLNSQPLPATLGISVEHILQESALPTQIAPSDMHFANHNTANEHAPVFLEQLPLVFDNGREQLQNLQLAYQDWRIYREVSRQYCALILLFGSGAGYALVLVSALLKWLPKKRYWVPVVILLAINFLLGSYWLMGATPLTPTLSLQSLVNYGVRTEKPETNVALNTKKNTKLVEELSSIKTILPAENITPVKLPPANYWLENSKIKTTLTDINKNTSLSFVADFEVDAPQFANNNWLDHGSVSSELLHGVEINEPIHNTTLVNTAMGTLYWHPLVNTPQNGIVEVEFTLPEDNAPLLLRIQANTMTHMGSTQTLIPLVVPVKNLQTDEQFAN
jgi:hypothetical protein